MQNPRRSVLFVPGSSQKMLEKARNLPCDVVVLDLEDSVAPEAKDASKEADAQKDAAKKPEEEKGEEYWRERMSRAREELRRNQMFQEALQTRINSLTNDFSARDDPYQRAQLADDRQKAMAEMARVTEEIESLKKQIADIEEEARQAGVPPGWLR